MRTIVCIALVVVLFVPCVAAEGHTLWRLPPPARWALDAKHRGPQVQPNTLPGELDAFTISAWVKPSAFGRYNEIFRIESGTGRVLFSFQENGKILSFGLHGTGYVECDGFSDATAKCHVPSAAFAGSIGL